MCCENLDKDLDFVSYFLRMNSHLFKLAFLVLISRSSL